MKGAEQQVAEAAREREVERVHEVFASLPEYKDMRLVRAARIEQVSSIAGHEAIFVTVPGKDGLQRIPLDQHWLQRFNPQPGGWLVTWMDGLPWYVRPEQFAARYQPHGYTLAAMVRQACRQLQVEGYDENLSDEQLLASLPLEFMNDLRLQYIAQKVEFL